MFKVNENDKSIHITRGDGGVIDVTASIPSEDEETPPEPYIFTPDDVVRFRIVEKNHYDKVILEKDADEITGNTECVSITLTKAETKIGEVINKIKEYWYEIELNPDSDFPDTIIGHDDDGGAKILKLYPEGDNVV